jgi:hypothetical protein
MDQDKIDKIVAATTWMYECARLEAIASGRPIVPEPWEHRDEAFRAQMVAHTREMAQRLKDGRDLPSPEEAHDSWVRAYEAMGWRYGPVRDASAKTHPDMVPYAELPQAERDKDEIYLALLRLALRWIVQCRAKQGSHQCHTGVT